MATTVGSTQGVGSSGGGGATSISEENSSFQFLNDFTSGQERKDEAVLVLKADLMAALNKEVKSLDEDNWKFAGPRSQIHRIARPGGILHKQSQLETSKQWNLAQ
ncbi:hypothetical protein MKW94_030504 [Papaver nudicaule]|uniref:Protein SAMBA n=1 Tax=Papaver nudicaule TaxID=74823 RepID=A0AA41RXV7_PAPNU|nr:hypothetical protein [Papaver nudicaule]